MKNHDGQQADSDTLESAALGQWVAPPAATDSRHRRRQTMAPVRRCASDWPAAWGSLSIRPQETLLDVGVWEGLLAHAALAKTPTHLVRIA